MNALVTGIRPFRLPLRHIFTTRRTTTDHRDGLLFSISDGVETGWGEATPMPGWSRESVESTAAALVVVTAAVSVIESASDPRLDRLLDDLDATPHARAAAAGAIADLRARRVGVPLAAMLGESSAGSVRVNAMVSASTPAAVARDCAAAIRDGFDSVKLKVGVADVSTDIDRVATARSVVGPDVELRLDANGSWEIDTAVAALKHLAAFDVSYCEEPAEGIAAIAAVGARSDIPVAIDESAKTIDDIAEALGTGSIGVVVVKPQALGGPDMAMRAVRLVHEFGATAVITSMIDGAIGVAHALHVAAASGVGMAHGLATSPLLSADVGPTIQICRGEMAIAESAGIGIVPFDHLPN